MAELDGVGGLEPPNDRIKIYCLTNLAIPQHEEHDLLNVNVKLIFLAKKGKKKQAQ